jgi:CRISPR-associated protein Cas6
MTQLDSIQTHYVEAAFPIQGTTLPLDHGYPLYAALSRLSSTLHEAQTQWGILPVAGIPQPKTGTLRLQDHSRVTLRLPTSQIAQILPWAGRSIDIHGHQVRLGIPNVSLLQPAQELGARFVTIKLKDSLDQDSFMQALLKQAQELHPELPQRLVLGRRRVMQIKDRDVVGYSVGARDLDHDLSLLLQVHGLGGRRKMGAGLFYPQKIEHLAADLGHSTSQEATHGSL